MKRRSTSVTDQSVRETDLATLLDGIVRRAMELVRGTSGVAYLWDDAQRVLVPHAWVGVGDWIGTLRIAHGEGAVGQAAERRQGLIVDDYPRSKLAVTVIVERWGPNAVLVEPLVYRDRLLGALALAKTGPRTRFAPADRRRLGPFVQQAVVAVENARLFTESEARRRRAEALADVGRLLSQTLDSAAVSDLVIESIRRLLGARSAALYRVERGTGALVAEHISASVAGTFYWTPRLEAGQGVIGIAVRDRRAETTRDVLADDRLDYAPDTRARIAESTHRALLAVPLAVQRRVFGGLAVGDRTGRVFGDEDVRLAQAFADQAALALENARIYDVARREAARMAALADVERLLSATLDPGLVARRIVDNVRDLLGARFAAVRRLDEATGTLTALAISGGSPEASNDRVFPKGAGVVGLAVAQRRPVSTPNVLDDASVELSDEHRALIAAASYRAVCAVPLMIGERVIGGLVIGDRAGRVFDDDDLRVAQAFADQAAVALENARLYGEAERRRREAEVVAELAASINAALDIDTVLRRVADGARELCGSDVARIAVRDVDTGVMNLLPTDTDATAVTGRTIEIGQGLGGRVLATGRPVRTTHYAADEEFTKDDLPAVRDRGAVAMMAVPIAAGGEIEGLLYVVNPADRPFSDRDEGILVRLADHAGIAIRNARLFARERAAHEDAERAADALRRAFDDLSRAQEQLAQSQKMEAVGRLAGGIAHDFNNLLTIMLGRTELLLRRVDIDPVRKPLELIQKTANRAAELTQQLLAFSRRQILQPQLLDLTAVVGGMAGMLRRLIGEDVELVLNTQAPIGLVNADPGRISQVVMNLAVNARDAMPRGGRLTIETRDVEIDSTYARDRGVPPGPFVMLAVHDTGSGMDAQTLGRIFEPFFTTKGVGQGSGLGLSMVYGIVQQSGGAIDVDSAPGRGATFRIFLPRVAGEAGGVTTSAAPAARPRGSETILIAEDEDEVRELAREILEDRGFRVLTARDGAEAVRVAEQHAGRIHLLLSDAVMPGMSGRELAEYLMPRRRDMRVLFMSGYTDDAMIRYGVSSADLFLPKPFTPDSLVETARAAIDRPETGSGAERGSETRT